MDNNVIGDDVARILFDKHPVDKKDFTIVVNISDETVKERSTKEMDDFILGSVFANNTQSAKPQDMTVEQEEPLDLRVFPQEKQTTKHLPRSNMKPAESHIQSNKVCS